MARGKYKRKRIRQQRRKTLIRDSGLSERVIRILDAHGINTLHDLDMLSDDTLNAMPRIGVKAMEEIHAIQMRYSQKTGVTMTNTIQKADAGQRKAMK